MDFELFLHKYYPSANTQKKNDISRFFSHIESLLESKRIEDALTDKTFLCKLFYLQATNGISRPHYLKVKDYLVNLCNLYGVNPDLPSRDEVIASQTTICYFENLESLLAFVDKVGAMQLTGYNKHADLANVKAILSLGWFGLSAQEIADLPKHCISRDEENFFVIKEDGCRVSINETAFAAIRDFIAIDEYRGLPTGRLVKLKGRTSSLIRTSVATSDTVTEGHIIDVIHRFNKIIPASSDYAINFRKLRKNALFVEIYNDKSDESLTSKIMRYMDCDRYVSYSYKHEYERWMELYHNN